MAPRNSRYVVSSGIPHHPSVATKRLFPTVQSFGHLQHDLLGAARPLVERAARRAPIHPAAVIAQSIRTCLFGGGDASPRE